MDVWLDDSCLSVKPANDKETIKYQLQTIPNWVRNNKKKMKTHLFYIEDKKVFNSADGRQNRTVKSADPANCLTVDDLQHVLRNGKLLLAPPLGQPTVTVAHDQPEGWMTPQGKRLEEQRRRQTIWNHQSHRFLFRMRRSIYAKTLRENTWINLHIC